jgi:hypothetical protein
MFQSARQAAWAHDVANIQFHGSDCGLLNFPLGSESVPELFSSLSHGGVARIGREDREARERIESEATGERYMADLRRLNPGRVEYAARRGLASSAAPAAAGPSSLMVASSSSAPGQGVIDLYDSDDSDDSFNA